ncbi:MAG: outer membrane beta-barrel protein [Deltaproteobacteria bacterium]|jgi:opacity protein-like surface antigen|nr:outer membrane beta-barrel protein [Deltaproteobacteria bacterium]
MMRRGVLCFVFSVFLALPVCAAAQEAQGMYAAPKFLLGGQNSGQVNSARDYYGQKSFATYSEMVYGGALAVGYDFGFPFRAEVEFALRSNAGYKGSEAEQSTNLTTLFVNAYYDFDTGTPFIPYVGGGLGIALNHTKLKATLPDGSPWTTDNYGTFAALNLGAGLAFAFTENVAADLGYRIIFTGYNEIKGADDNKVYSAAPYIHEFYLGMRFTFN